MIPLFIFKEKVLQLTTSPLAKVIAHSISSVTGQEFITFEIEVWRGVLAELNTHKALSKNTSSSRAIPIPSMLKFVRETPGMPFRFGAANTGMTDNGAHNADIVFNDVDEDGNQLCLPPVEAWVYCVGKVAEMSEAFHDAGYAKQISNRLTEIGQTSKVVISGTDWANFYWLRDHTAADPTIEKLAQVMLEAHKASVPVVLKPGEWHTPYYQDGFWKAAPRSFSERSLPRVDSFGVTLEDALAISASCCAQASYRKLDDTLEKARGVVARLNLGVDVSEPCHASPTEHQGTPIAPSEYYIRQTEIYDSKPACVHVNDPQYPDTWQKGITHMMRDGTFGSGNLKGFIQYRQLIPGNVYTGEFK